MSTQQEGKISTQKLTAQAANSRTNAANKASKIAINKAEADVIRDLVGSKIAYKAPSMKNKIKPIKRSTNAHNQASNTEIQLYKKQNSSTFHLKRNTLLKTLGWFKIFNYL